MAITYPRTELHSLTGLMMRFTLVSRSETSSAASGETRVKSIGPALWRGEFQSEPLKEPQAGRMAAWLDSLDDGAGTFTAYDVRRPYPADDPTGAADLSGVAIASLSDGSLSLDGLPASFGLTEGDYLAFDWGAGRRAYHRVAEAVEANGLGATPVFAVRPPIRAGAAVDAAVTLVRPRAVWMLDPGSVSVEAIGVVASQFSWTATQVV